MPVATSIKPKENREGNQRVKTSIEGNRPRLKAHPEAIAPDAWIEEHAAGFTPPEDSQDRKISS